MPCHRLDGMQCSQLCVHERAQADTNHEAEVLPANYGTESLMLTYTDSIKEDDNETNAKVCASSEDANDSGDEAATMERINKKISTFDEDEFIAYFMEQKRDRAPSFGSTCYLKLCQQQVSSQAKVFGYFKSIMPVDNRNRMFRI